MAGARKIVSHPDVSSSSPATRPPLFTLEDLYLSRGGRPVLSGVTVEIPSGSTAVVGPSGAGKSTLLRLLNRLADPDRGAIRYRDRDLRDYDVLALRRSVMLVPQLPSLLDGTVADNITYGPRLANITTDVPQALARAGLATSFACRRVAELSVGEQQRVMLARALALRPEVLLLDEPTSALDPAARDGIEATLLHLREQLNVSYILVTHDAAQAHRLGDQFILLNDGRVQP
jgi:putative ABC transport system ATP-binding protein